MEEHLKEIVYQRQKSENYFVEQSFTLINGKQELIDKTRIISSIEALVNCFDRVIIQGYPGSGKTENLRHVQYVFTSLYLKSPDTLLPVYIDLSWLNENIKIQEILLQKVGEKLYRKKLLILLDAFDAININNKEGILSQIDYLSEKCQASKIIIATRPSIKVNLNKFKNFIIAEINSLDQRQIEEFLLRKEITNWKRLKESLISTKWISEYIKNPFFLSLIVQYQDIFLSSNLYTDPISIIDALLQKSLYEMGKRLFINSRIINEMLEHISFIMHMSDVNSISEETIHYSLPKKLNINLIEKVGIEKLLSELIQHHILVPIESNRYSFSHISISEYFLTTYLRKISGIKQSHTLINLNSDIIIGLKISEIQNRESLKKLLFSLRDIIYTPNINFIPLYAQKGSLVIAIAILGISALGYAFKKFADSFFSQFGQEAAKNIISKKDKIKLPEKIINKLPSWIADNPTALQKFTNELITAYAQNTMNEISETELVRIGIYSVWNEKFGTNIEQVPIEKILGSKQG